MINWFILTAVTVLWLKHVFFFPFELQTKCKKYPAREKGAVLVVWESLLALPWFRFLSTDKTLSLRNSKQTRTCFWVVCIKKFSWMLKRVCGGVKRNNLLVCVVDFWWDSHSGYVFYNMLKFLGVNTTFPILFFFIYYKHNVWLQCLITRICVYVHTSLTASPVRMCPQHLCQPFCVPFFQVWVPGKECESAVPLLKQQTHHLCKCHCLSEALCLFVCSLDWGNAVLFSLSANMTLCDGVLVVLTLKDVRFRVFCTKKPHVCCNYLPFLSLITTSPCCVLSHLPCISFRMK